jgi:transposase
MGSYAGIDWASAKHDVLIEDPAGEELLAATFAHDEDGVSALCAALACFDVELVAIERPDGLLVDRLLEAGMRVLALHPNQVKAARGRFRASGGKSDRFDRFVLCELARTDSHRFRVLEPDSDQTKALRALSRARENLVGARVALANQLRAELERFWPGPIGLFADLDSPISLAFLARYPSPADARGLGVKRLATFLKAHRYTNRKTPAQLLERLRSAPAGRAGEIETRTRRMVVVGLTHTLQMMVEQIAELESEIARALGAHPDGAIFRAFFRSPDAVICAATLLSEIGDCRARYPHRDSIAADGGQAPVAIESGKRRAPDSAGPATSDCETRWARWRSTPVAGIRGRLTSTRRPEPAATVTAARCAPSAAPYAASSGAAGKTAPPTTQPDTPGCNSTSPSPSPTRRAPGPTSPPPSEWPAPLSPARAAQRAERTALDSKPPIATHTNIDTGRLWS